MALDPDDLPDLDDPFTATDALRMIAYAKTPDRCPHCTVLTVRALGLWLPDDDEWPL